MEFPKRLHCGVLLLFASLLAGSSSGTHECARECVEGAPPMNCRYTFAVEWYVTMSKACYDCRTNVSDCFRPDCVPADGYSRPVVVVNRQMPGPTIEVCQGDYVVVDVENHMMEESTTIHWHGHHQRGTPYMDGVPYVTQCPIPPKSAFRYQYYATTSGTHFWHSHSGCQRADGAFGGFVVRVPKSWDPHTALYDRDLPEHLVQILDWVPEMGVHKFVDHHHGLADNKPRNILVNGLGRNVSLPAVLEDPWGVDDTSQPTATFVVQQGLRYRFRLINAGFLNVPIQMSVDNHTMTVISSDGFDIEPIQVDSLVSYAGERFDVVLTANQSVGSYWVRFRGLMDGDERFTSVHQVAILRYEGAPLEDPPGDVGYDEARRDGLVMNELNVGTEGSDGTVSMPELTSLQPDDESLKPEADFTFYLAYDFYPVDNPHFFHAPYYGFGDAGSHVYTPQFNHISMKLPPFPLLSQRDLLAPDMFCNSSTVGNCTAEFCECLHVLAVPLGAVVELIFVDEGVPYDANHPFHLHGHAFRVVAMERLGNTTTVDEVKALDAAGLLRRNLHRAPYKDTVTVPDGGYTVVRLHASNPGYWLLHCHIEFHVEIGMAVVLKVGEDSQMAPVPRGFPRCDSWLPDREDLDDMPTSPAFNYSEGRDGDEGPSIVSLTHWLPAIVGSPAAGTASSGRPQLGLLCATALAWLLR
ncbi:uncharacterized protein LOC134542927 [Bacillus rossius redtenbacheri]|uniref:uncharacterized protein LOC134542927 n=1 Tax=Bacillus rossius redtenbacheri TaxID=93214 RepID=UPI002FDDE5F0